MVDSTFIHLNVHSEYSLVDGTVRIKPLVQAVAAAGMPAVALTDQSNLFALVKFYRACLGAGIKPIVGCDIWVEEQGEPFRLVLLCQNRTGYLNLSELISRAYLENQHHGRPVVKRDWISQAHEGLIALSGALQGDLVRPMMRGREKVAERRLARWQSDFGDRFYLAVTRSGREQEELAIKATTFLADRSSCPVVATNQVRFLEQANFPAHEARVCIHQGNTLDDPRRPRTYSDQQYLKSSEEMATLFADLDGVVENSLEIAKRCNLEMALGEYFLPAFPTPDDQDADEYLRQLSREGLTQRAKEVGLCDQFERSDYDQRLEIELDVVIDMGFPGYFLIVADFIQWAKENHIPVGPGRGSGAGSLVAWALGITDIDPLPYDLLFERFLNPERVSMPDFDIDFCMDKRDMVIDYVARRYGRDQVCQIITYGSMTAKAVIRDTGRVLGFPYGLVDGIARLIPPTVGIELETALKEEPALKERYDEEEEVKELIDLALSLEGLTRNAGKHAGGVVIAPGPLTHYSPLYCEAGGANVVTQFDKKDVESAGLVKFDFLGLKTLTIIDWALGTINEQKRREGEKPLILAEMPLDDKRTFDLLKSCMTTAVFQLESRGMKELIRNLQPDCFEDIVALVALFRPGPLESGMVGDYVDRKHGRAQVEYPHPALEPVLKPTYGVILYQEQVMQIAQVLAGYTLGGADLLRRAMGKKDAAEMAQQRDVFVTGAAENDVDSELANAIFDLMETFAGYGFNKSHSAAYALIAYQTAYIKAHHPADFMAAVLSADMDNTDKTVAFIDEAKAMDLTTQPPDVNCSSFRFTVVDDSTIVYGLGAIKGVGQGPVKSIAEARDAGGPFRDLLDLCRRVEMQKFNKRVFEALLRSGALDALGANRATLEHDLDGALRTADQESRDRSAGQSDMFGAAPSLVTPGDQGVRPEWSEEQRLTGERDTLGLYLTGHPINRHLPWLQHFTTCRIADIADHYEEPVTQSKNRNRGSPFVMSGLVLSVRPLDRVTIVTIDDGGGRLDLVFYGKTIHLASEYLVKDRIIVVDGLLRSDEYSGGYRLNAQKVMDVEGAVARYAGAIEVCVEEAPPDFTSRLQRCISAHLTGDSQVVVNYKNRLAKLRLSLGDEWQVRVSTDLIESLQGLNGVTRVNPLFGSQSNHTAGP